MGLGGRFSHIWLAIIREALGRCSNCPHAPSTLFWEPVGLGIKCQKKLGAGRRS